ncbi:MAG: HAD-IA family hydrolase [Syntrophomonadaceae bacterium]
MKISLETVIFDFDGVIIDSGTDITSAVNHTRGLFGLPDLPGATIIEYIGDGVRVLVERSFKGCAPEVLEQALSQYRKYYQAHALDETRLYPHVRTTLEAISSRGKKIALVTNKSEPLAELILSGLQVRPYFNLVVGPESVQRMKPDPQGLVKVLDTFQTAARRAIMVGDTHSDIEAGRRAGTWTCGARYGLGNKKNLVMSRPDLMIDDIAELMAYIL